jgi:dihydroorotase
MKILIRNGRVIDPRHGRDEIADVHIAAGKIIHIGAADAQFEPQRELDATGCVVCPGLVDLAVRLREPGFEYRATLESEMAAAAAGGVTSLACPPDTDPVLDEPGLVEMLKFRARNLPGPRVYPIGALTLRLGGEILTELAQLREAGCMAFSQADTPITDTQVMLHALEYAATFDYPVWLRPQDAWLGRGAVAHDGPVASRLGLMASPVLAETTALSTLLLLVRETRARVHFCRLSSRESVALIRAARQEGLPVSCDVSISHLHFSEMDLLDFDSNLHLLPPVRSLRDRDALRAALADGGIDVLCSDHAPLDDDAKQLPFAETTPGASGVELLLPALLKWAEETATPLITALARVTCAPAQILGINAGHLAPGAPADLCVFDPLARVRVTTKALRSQGKNTPFMGYELPGRVRYTLIDGHLDYEA